MPDRTKATAPARAGSTASGGVATAPTATASTAGVLRPGEFARHVDLVREPVGPSAGHWVENRWSLRWDLPGGRWYDSEVLPHPTCSLTVELGSHPRAGMPPGETVAVTGVCTRRFDVVEWQGNKPYPEAQVVERPELVWKRALQPLKAEAEAVVRRALAQASEFAENLWPADLELSADPVAAAWQLAGIAPIGELDQIRLLRSTSMEELLGGVIELTADAQRGFFGF